MKGATLDRGELAQLVQLRNVVRLGIPALQESDAGLGVANPFNVRPGASATPLPSSLALAATWDKTAAYAGGAMIGQEAWRSGFN